MPPCNATPNAERSTSRPRRATTQFLSVALLLATLLTTLLTMCVLPQQPSFAQTSLDADLRELTTLFTGEFDNFQQVWKEREDKAVEPHEHIHSIFFPVKLPEFGEQVFYVKQYMDGDPRKIYRQRIYAFKKNPQEGAIQLDIFSFAVDSLYDNAHLAPIKLQGLKPAAMQTNTGCAVYWKKNAGEASFTGYMKDRACFFPSKRTGKKIYVTDSLRLSADELWIRDEATDQDGNYVFGHKGKIPHKLKRCRFFTGFAVVQKNPQAADSAAREQYHTMRNIRLHDQGERLRIVGESGEQTKYTIELSQVLYGKGLPVIKLAVYEDGNTKAVAYTWANPDAKRLGINLRYMQTGFTLVESP
jgi:hypothetical protein